MATILTNSSFLFRVADMISETDLNLCDTERMLTHTTTDEVGPFDQAAAFATLARSARITSQLLEACEEELLTICKTQMVPEELSKLVSISKQLTPANIQALCAAAASMLPQDPEAAAAQKESIQ